MTQRRYDALTAEIDRLHTFAGLLTILDHYYPADVFTDSAEDVGARLVVLARRLAGVEIELDALRTAAREACEAEFTSERLEAMDRLRSVLGDDA